MGEAYRNNVQMGNRTSIVTQAEPAGLTREMIHAMFGELERRGTQESSFGAFEHSSDERVYIKVWVLTTRYVRERLGKY